jgi:hypothetical protein
VAPDSAYDFAWFWRARLPERNGEPCRILVRSRRLNSCLVEFPDGFRVVTSRNAVRRRAPTGLLASQVDLLPKPGEEALHRGIVDQVQHQKHRPERHREGYDGPHSSHLTGADIDRILEKD